MKRVCALLLCAALSVPPAFAVSDTQWPAWAEQALSWGQDVSISQEFLRAPEKTVTRGEAAQLLYEAAGRKFRGPVPFLTYRTPMPTR